MTDRELLERAARAADIGIECWHPRHGSYELYDGTLWNPLEGDDDAFRLMVDCDMTVTIAYGQVMATHDYETNYAEPLGDNPHSATRRAIVRAAAEMAE